ncbi:MAG: TrkH family potassium uptake protein [Patescibacteria group bacterium]
MHFRLILHSLGNITLLMIPAMSVSMLWSLIDGTSDVYAFIHAVLAAMVIGGALRLVKPRGTFERRDGFAIVFFGWLLVTAIGALPFVLSGSVPTYTDAFFETMSGFTTTGATVIAAVEDLPRGILFWRSLTHWLGGMGIIVLSLAIFSIFQTGNALYNAEVPGHAKDKFLPRLRHAAAILWLIYTIISLMEIVSLKLAGISFFDSLIHTFGSMGTGGYSSRNISVEAFKNPAAEMIMVVFMILAGINFSLYYRVFQKKSLKALFNLETRTFLAIIALATTVIGIFLIGSGAVGSLATAMRQAVFQVTSIITTTGFSSTNFDFWPPLAKGILLLLMFIGACTGSTGGAMKVARIVLLFKYARRQITKVAHPRLVVQTKLDDSLVTDSVVHEVLSFFFLYIALYVVGSLTIMATGQDVVTSISASAATLGNIGPGLNVVGPYGNYASFHPLAKWTCSFLMLAGRLEILTVLVIFTPSFWRR